MFTSPSSSELLQSQSESKSNCSSFWPSELSLSVDSKSENRAVESKLVVEYESRSSDVTPFNKSR